MAERVGPGLQSSLGGVDASTLQGTLGQRHRSLHRAWPLSILLVHLAGCGGRLATNRADSDTTTDDTTATDLPPAIMTCDVAPPELPLATPSGQVQPVHTESVTGWNWGWTVLGGQGEYLFVQGCGGGRLGGGCGIRLVGRAQPSFELLATANLGATDFPRPWANTTEILFPPTNYYSGSGWSSATSVTAGHDFAEATGASTRDLWIKEPVRAGGGIYRVIDGIATLVPPPDLGQEKAEHPSLNRIQAGSGEELWALEAREKSELWHLTAGAWSRTGLVDIAAIFVPSDHSVWAVGGSSIHRFEGGCWVSWLDPRTKRNEPATELRRVWARSRTDVWVTGDDDLLRHWDGEAWSLVSIDPDQSHKLGDIWGTPSGMYVFLQPHQDTVAEDSLFFMTTVEPDGTP